MKTKDKILKEALHLFSQKGYDAVSVEQIATAVGIKAPSLYNHYKGKKDIFEAIFSETSRRYDAFANQIALRVPQNNMEKEFQDEIQEEKLVKKHIDLFLYSIQDEFVSQFRKMLTIEQFRNEEIAQLYTERFVTILIDYHEKIFSELMRKGIMKKGNAKAMATMYDAPMIVFLGVCDRQPDKVEECSKQLEEHVRLFFRQFSNLS